MALQSYISQHGLNEDRDTVLQLIQNARDFYRDCTDPNIGNRDIVSYVITLNQKILMTFSGGVAPAVYEEFGFDPTQEVV